MAKPPLAPQLPHGLSLSPVSRAPSDQPTSTPARQVSMDHLGDAEAASVLLFDLCGATQLEGMRFREADLVAAARSLHRGFPTLDTSVQWGSEKRSPLNRASKRGYKMLVEFLIATGAQVNKCDDLGRTPLHEAAVYGKRGVCQQLLDAGANLEARSHKRETPLMRAVITGHRRVAAYLIEVQP
mmetsp:Transcript_19691/g.59630  ORF Transcript_19691/g.59630 Transcript_19691/m.59630 type:complete len:184 (+) Transcript_19691:121-672(+)